eukprot:1767454-Pyramimonas_sp.AAC.1
MAIIPAAVVSLSRSPGSMAMVTVFSSFAAWENTHDSWPHPPEYTNRSVSKKPAESPHSGTGIYEGSSVGLETAPTPDRGQLGNVIFDFYHRRRRLSRQSQRRFRALTPWLAVLV